MIWITSLALAAEPTFHWDPAVDVPVTLGSGGVWFLMYANVEDGLSPAGAVANPTGPDALLAPRYNSSFGTTSDVLLYGSIGTGLGLAVLDGALDGEGAHTRAFLVVESFALNQFATTTLKLAVDRPRPYTALGAGYSDEVDELLGEKDSEMSFPSGHTSTVAQMAFVTARIYDLSGATRPQRIGAYSLATAATVAAGSLRVGAGVHHPTDVVAGALLGGCIGFLVPTVHVTDRRVSVAATTNSVALSTSW